MYAPQRRQPHETIVNERVQTQRSRQNTQRARAIESCTALAEAIAREENGDVERLEKEFIG